MSVEQYICGTATVEEFGIVRYELYESGMAVGFKTVRTIKADDGHEEYEENVVMYSEPHPGRVIACPYSGLVLDVMDAQYCMENPNAADHVESQKYAERDACISGYIAESGCDADKVWAMLTSSNDDTIALAFTMIGMNADGSEPERIYEPIERRATTRGGRRV